MTKKSLFEQEVELAEEEERKALESKKLVNPDTIDTEKYKEILINKMKYEFPGIHFWQGFSPNPEIISEKIENSLVQLNGTLPVSITVNRRNASKQELILDQKFICAWILPPRDLDAKVPFMNDSDYFYAWKNNLRGHPILNQYNEYGADYGFEIITEDNMDSILGRFRNIVKKFSYFK